MKLREIKDKYLDTIILVFLGISFTAPGLSIALSSYGLGIMIVLLAVKIIWDKRIYPDDKYVIYLLIIFAAWQLVTSLLSNDPYLALINTLRKISLYLVFISAVLVISNKKQLKNLLVALFLFTAVLSLYESVRYIIDFNSQNTASLSDFRLNYFGHSITLGEIKMLVLLLMLPFILSKEAYLGKINKWILTGAALLVFFALFFTNSRNALLGLFAGILIIGIVKHRYFLIGCVIVVTLFLYLAPIHSKERIFSIADLDHPSNKSRIIMWVTGIKMIKDSPIIGYGDVEILNIYKKYKEPEFHAEGSHMHNNIMQIAVVYGILGLIVWLVLMIYILVRQIKIYIKIKDDEFLKVIILSSIACMAAFHVSGLTEWNFGDAEFAVLLWFSLSIPFAAEKIYVKKLRQ